jgi:excisionase family DNA binding protein
MIDPHERPLLANYIRVREAAVELKMSQATLYRHLSLKKIKTRKFGRWSYIRRDEIQKWVDSW